MTLRRTFLWLLGCALLVAMGLGGGIAGVLVYDDLKAARFVEEHAQYRNLWHIVGRARPDSDNNYTDDVTEAVCARFDSDGFKDDWARIPESLVPRVHVTDKAVTWRFVQRKPANWLEWARVLEIEQSRNSGKCRAAVLYSSLI